MASLFIDANILLDFYRLGKDDISELGKLTKLISDNEISLYFNQHLKNEIERNRDAVLSESLSKLRSTKLSINAPNFCAQMKELDELVAHMRNANKAHSKLIKEVEDQIHGRRLAADQLISTLFAGAREIYCTQEVLAAARERVELGNPPGKKGSLGDALHWECLLKLDHGYSMHIVSRDADFASEISPGTIKAILSSEWKETHSQYASIELFQSLTDFFRSKFPDVKLSEEFQKDELISQLATSPNFATTHSVIERLSNFDFFTNGQVRRLFKVLTENSQVGWIATDDDVKGFFTQIRTNAFGLPTEVEEAAAKLLEVDRDSFFFPF